MMKRKTFAVEFLFTVLIIGGAISRPSRAESRDDESGSVMRSIVETADSIGFSCQWERAFRRLTCIRQPEQVRLYQDNCFYYHNGSVERLPVAPVRIGPALCLPVAVLQDIFGQRKPAEDKTGRDGQRMELAATAPEGLTIKSVVAETKSNGTLLTITLSDSLPLDITYYYPNLTFNFYGGRLDTNALRQGKRVGVIDSIFSLQFKQSAQITALLVREIEEPMIDYVSDTRKIMVSLWPKKQVKKKTAPVVAAKTEKRAKQQERPMVIVLDPGHGGKDPGCIGPGETREKDVVLAVGLKVREMLAKKKNIKVFMTRDSDVFIPLGDRTKFANEKRADLFVSIHADAISGNAKRKQSISGYKIYFLSQAKNEEDKLVAMRENAVIELEEQPHKYSNLQNVLIEMAGNEYLKESQDLCIFLDQKFTEKLSKKIVKLHRGVGQANFWVLNGAFMPSVLIETGFLSHKKEEKLLKDKLFQKELASAISDAVISFCDKVGVLHE